MATVSYTRMADMTQSDIAEVVGVSQMQVSRLITRALDTLRARLAPDTA